MKKRLILLVLIVGCLHEGPVDAAEAQWLDVRQFGAKGDGRTNDAPAIQHAFDEAGKSHVGVYIPEGHYLYAPSEADMKAKGSAYAMALRVNGIAVRGAGAGKTILVYEQDRDPFVTHDGNPTTDARYARNAHNGVLLAGDGGSISDLSLEVHATEDCLLPQGQTDATLGFGPNNRCRVDASYTSGIFLPRGTSHYAIERVDISHTRGCAIFDQGSKHGKILSVHIAHSHSSGIQQDTSIQPRGTEDAPEDLEFANNLIEDVKDDAIFAGASLVAGVVTSHVHIHDNVINFSTHGRGVTIGGAQGVVIENNKMIGSSHGGILIEAGGVFADSPTRDVTVRKNTLYNTNWDPEVGGFGSVTLNNVPEKGGRYVLNNDIRIEGNTIANGPLAECPRGISAADAALPGLPCDAGRQKREDFPLITRPALVINHSNDVTFANNRVENFLGNAIQIKDIESIAGEPARLRIEGNQFARLGLVYRDGIDALKKQGGYFPIKITGKAAGELQASHNGFEIVTSPYGKPNLSQMFFCQLSGGNGPFVFQENHIKVASSLKEGRSLTNCPGARD